MIISLVQNSLYAMGENRRVLRRQRFHRFLSKPGGYRLRRGQCKLLPVLPPQVEQAIASGTWNTALSLAADIAIAQADTRFELELAGGEADG